MDFPMVSPYFPRGFPIENAIFWEKVRPSLDEPMAIGDFGAGGLFSHDVGDGDNVGHIHDDEDIIIY